MILTKEATGEPLLRSSCKRFGASFPHRNYYSVSIQLFPPLLLSFLPSIIGSEEGKERRKSRKPLLPSSSPTTGTSCLAEGHGFVFGRTWKTPSGAKGYSVGTSGTCACPPSFLICKNCHHLTKRDRRKEARFSHGFYSMSMLSFSFVLSLNPYAAILGPYPCGFFSTTHTHSPANLDRVIHP